ncbi:MAG: hypothetical protein KDA98_11770 [Acidimicrobiales bacterium]|nr:hypothetical protein [Acidimicrobiales bacterium]
MRITRHVVALALGVAMAVTGFAGAASAKGVAPAAPTKAYSVSQMWTAQQLGSNDMGSGYGYHHYTHKTWVMTSNPANAGATVGLTWTCGSVVVQQASLTFQSVYPGFWAASVAMPSQFTDGIPPMNCTLTQDRPSSVGSATAGYTSDEHGHVGIVVRNS